ncbi:MAG: 2-oxo acid dehydrogenase subunit E2, partial [Brachybacterium sp.]|nr:2-oxo acid dehydrogenase subunit E2 [Brachybacterium sp.]
MMSDFTLPDLGEGLTEATIVTWNVAVGDEVTRNQAIAEVETAKSLVELPSPRAGMISALYATEGETLAVGSPLIGF